MAKTCKQCGTLKPLDQFRSYYGGRKGTYTICRTCEKINSRVKYLESKAELNDGEKDELKTIMELWEAQRKLGLQPPRTTNRGVTPVINIVTEMLDTYSTKAKKVAAVMDDYVPAPAELLDWLAEELTEDPDYYLDYIYEKLKSKYRPVLHIDPTDMLPVHDETYAGILDKILDKFYRYEDEYYARED